MLVLLHKCVHARLKLKYLGFDDRDEFFRRWH